MNKTHDLLTLQAGGTSDAVPAPPRRWLARVVVPATILLLVVAVLAFASRDVLVPRTPVQVVPTVVKTMQGPEAQNAGAIVQRAGWLEPDPHPYYVSALTEGVVEEVLALEGQPVEKGQILVRMVDDDAILALRRAEAERLEMDADVARAQADLDAAKQTLGTLVERRRNLATAEAALAKSEADRLALLAGIQRDEAGLAELKDELERKVVLVKSGAVPEIKIAGLRLQIDAQVATIAVTRAGLDVVDAQRRTAIANLEAARQHIELLIEERRAVDQATAAVMRAHARQTIAEVRVEEARLLLDRISVRSPVDGIVMRRLVSPGSRLDLGSIEHGSHVFHLYNPEELQVRVDVPLADAALVGVGQAAEIIVDVLPDRVFKGRVTRVGREADIAKNTVEVKVAVDNPSPELAPEMLARVKFLPRPAIGDGPANASSGLRQRIYAPDELLRTDGAGGRTVMVVTDLEAGRGRAVRRVVTLGQTQVSGWSEIESGLRPGDLLVADPTAVDAGARVRVVGEAMGFDATAQGGS